MTDPAIEAAQRAWNGAYTDPVDGAHEALKPIREWYELQTQMWVDGTGGISPLLLDGLAPLIFTSEELER